MGWSRVDDEPCRGEGLQQHVLLRGGEGADYLVAVEDSVPNLLLGAAGTGGDARADAGAAGVLLGGDVDARSGGGGGDAGDGAEGGHFLCLCVCVCVPALTTRQQRFGGWGREDF